MSEFPRTPIPDPLLEVRDLRVSHHTSESIVPVVQGVSFAIERGRTLAVVGKSGSGKSVTAYSILRLLQPRAWISGGRILLHSARAGSFDITRLPENSPSLFQIRGGLVSIIFQEPASALSPLHPIGNQVAEAVSAHQKVPAAEARRRALAMLGRVGIAPSQYGRYPHEISGGMRQRVVVAMALVGSPELLIADEPTTALDVTIQAQILALIRSLQQEIGFSVLLITHDFSVVAQMAERVAVMEAGRIVECGNVRAVLKHPQHPYTQALLDALPARRHRDVPEWQVAAVRSA